MLAYNILNLNSFTFSLAVLKSDAGNGVFGFDPFFLSNLISEPGNISLMVIRERGTFETVLIYWEVREQSEEGNLASDDFLPASGYLEFLPGVTEQDLILVTVNELVPELSEDFVVILLSAIAGDNQTSSTPTSGASINASLALAQITVDENDYPYGLLQFAIFLPSPGETILPASSMPEIFVQESDSSVTVYIVRAQGNLGTVSAEYITEDGTASSSGVSPDYIASAGMVTFGTDDRVHNLTLTLLDDFRPELGKVFYIRLTNPSGGLYLYYLYIM